jgi:ATP-dependent Lhr-like helicase
MRSYTVKINIQQTKNHDVAVRWFETKGWTPFDFQRGAWEAYLQGKSGLIHAPTGIGKTYAAWFGALMDWVAEARGQSVKPCNEVSPMMRVLWVTPLRALATDIHAALLQVVDELDLPWSVECRTGDTAASVKNRQKRRLPTALVTTPESLHLLLSYSGAREKFDHLQLVVVDEWHELMGSKRGVLVELALARLRSWNRRLRIWGLSATLNNPENAMSVLLGSAGKGGRLIRGLQPDTIDVESVIPLQMERFPWAGHLGLKTLPQVLEKIENAESTLIFTNTRSQAELWFQAILEARPAWLGALALHHGSLDRKERQNVESGLRNGDLTAVVCTSSLDLGVDFTPVDLVVQIGSPKGIARLMQRAGRSGHRPRETSRLVCVPTHAFELMEVAAARRFLHLGNIESRDPITLPLDVLAQHLVTMALGDGFSADEMFRELKRTYAFQDLTRNQFEWVLDFVSTGGKSLGAYADFKKIVLKNGRYTAVNRKIAARHRMNIGTISADAAVLVKFVNGRRLGSVEERFVSRLKRGDVFVFAGRPLEFIRMKDMTVLVRKSRSRRGPVPQWMGGKMPLSTELGTAVREQLDFASRKKFGGLEMGALRPILELQKRWSIIPRRQDLLIEKCISRDGHHLFIFPFEGHLVNEGLGALLAYRLSRKTPLTLAISVNDYGLELLCDREIPLEGFKDSSVFSTDRLLEDILESVNSAEMGRRQFREIARIAGLVFQGYPGRPKSGGQIQASSSLLYNVFQRYEPENLLFKQSTREVLERQLEYCRLLQSLNRIVRANLRLIETDQFTPLAFPILANRLRTVISSEKLAERVKRMSLRLEIKADKEISSEVRKPCTTAKN